MVELAIIDDGVSEVILGKTLNHNIEIDDDFNVSTYCDKKILNHATECALIIEKYCQGISLSSVKVIHSQFGKITTLIEGFKWCYENNIKIVHFSLGSINYNDRSILQYYINLYANKGIVFICPNSNNKFVTYPACLSNTISVITLGQKVSLEPFFISASDKWLGTDFLANSVHSVSIFEKGKQTTHKTLYSNSYAAPLITANVCQLLKQNPDLNVCQLKRLLKSYILNEKKDISSALRPDWISNAFVVNIANRPLEQSEFYFKIVKQINLSKLNVNIVIQEISILGNEIDSIIFNTSLRNSEDVLYMTDNIIKSFKYNTVLLHDGVTDGNCYIDPVWGYRHYCVGDFNQWINQLKGYSGTIYEPIIFLEYKGSESLCFAKKLKALFNEDGYNAFVLSNCPQASIYQLEYLNSNSLLTYSKSLAMYLCVSNALNCFDIDIFCFSNQYPYCLPMFQADLFITIIDCEVGYQIIINDCDMQNCKNIKNIYNYILEKF